MQPITHPVDTNLSFATTKAIFNVTTVHDNELNTNKTRSTTNAEGDVVPNTVIAGATFGVVILVLFSCMVTVVLVVVLVHVNRMHRINLSNLEMAAHHSATGNNQMETIFSNPIYQDSYT